MDGNTETQEGFANLMAGPQKRNGRNKKAGRVVYIVKTRKRQKGWNAERRHAEARRDRKIRRQAQIREQRCGQNEAETQR